MASLYSFVKRAYTFLNPPSPPKATDALKCGILGAANIAPLAFILPVRNHPEVVIAAVACRDKTKGDKYAKKWGIEKVYSGANGYQELLNDPEISIIYNPLPNGLHFEWTLKALQAGKHVLLEKPFTDTAEEARILFKTAEEKGLVLLEALHHLFHPANRRVKEILDSGELGKIKSIEASLCVPSIAGVVGSFSDDDIRFNFDLGGGSYMDMGIYPLSTSRFFAGASPVSVTSASVLQSFPKDSRIDVGMSSTFTFPLDIVGSTRCHMRLPGYGPFGIIPRMPDVNIEVQCEGGSVSIFNFVLPSLYHWIAVKPKKGKERTEKVYSVEDDRFGPGGKIDYWSTYRHQLEAFVDKVKGREPKIWFSAEDSIAHMTWIENVYEKAGLPKRPSPISH